MKQFIILVPQGGMLFEAVGIVDILNHANELYYQKNQQNVYHITVVTPQPHEVIQGVAGINLLAHQTLDHLSSEAPCDTIIVTGKGISDAEREKVTLWIKNAASHARRVASVCGGALILAATGLLNGRCATTHWKLLDTLQQQYPKIKVQKGPIYVQDDNIWTSAGVSSGFDLTLALIEEDCGFDTARDVAQDLVMFLRRPGGQSQFSRYLLTQAQNPGPIRELQNWIAQHLDSDLSVNNLANHVSMSPRNFTRIFTRETGITPAKYVEKVRLDEARRWLEQSQTQINIIAHKTGFGHELNLRRVFERNFQITPSDYRQRFHIRS
ncbi:MAG: HTH-type transcriptional activator RhaS [Candidatus Celerinatantimonas neptuna]|nr:MAG: HTH-type transcriptional activator RhaS [Candidatus Celerinatantimonas neptuna]